MTSETKASNATPGVAVAAEPTLAPKRANPLLDQRFIPPLFITLLLVVGQLTFGVVDFPKTLAAIVASILIEMILGKLITGKIPHLASVYISGISVGILIRSPEWWPYILCSMIAITSKYVIRVKGRHIWNPSNLGICVMLLVAAGSVATLSIQWGNSLWPMLVIWALGCIIIYRLKRFHICATYVLSFIAYALLRSAITHHDWTAEIAPLLANQEKMLANQHAIRNK